jgi:hypothetical protein
MPKDPTKEAMAINQTVCPQSLPFHPDRKITGRFDGGKITSDAGLLLFYALDQQHRLSQGFSACLADARDGSRIRHQLWEMVRQRLHQIVAGYEDCNDADTLRGDPILKTVCDRLPDSDPDLASQPTLSRLENAVGIKDLMRLGRWFLKRYVGRLAKRRPEKIVLDLDSTDDPTHGQQELSFYHGYYRSHLLHPLLIFDGDSGDLISAVLRPGNKGAAHQAVAVLGRVVAAVRKALPKVQIEVRADSGFATPQLYDFCEQEGLQYVIGLSRNPRLERAVEPLLERSVEQFEESRQKQREFGEFRYQAQTWKHPRRVVAKVEVHEVGINRRFVVTNRTDLSPEPLYDHYTDRGQTENYIKAFKTHLKMDRLSCHRFWANQFRLLLHALAYQMFLIFRDYLWGTPWQNLEVETLRRRMLKIGARIRETTRRIWVHFSSAYPEQRVFWLVWDRLHPT